MELLTATDAGRVLGLSATRVRQLARERRLRVSKRTRGGIRLFKLQDVLAFKEEREAASKVSTEDSTEGDS